MNSAIGMLEFNSIALGIETADFMVKAAKVDLLRSSTVCPGKYIVIVGGEVSSVQSSMKTGLARADAVRALLFGRAKTSAWINAVRASLAPTRF